MLDLPAAARISPDPASPRARSFRLPTMEELIPHPRISWEFTELWWILLGTAVCVLLTGSRTRPMPEVLGTVLAAHFLVINTICWNAFIGTMMLVQGDYFRFGLTPLLPAVSFYGGILVIAVPPVCLLCSLLRRPRYRVRQLAAHTIAVLLVSTGLWVTIRTPVVFQRVADEHGIPREVFEEMVRDRE